MRDGGFESKSEIRDSVEPADLGFGAGLSGKQGGPKLSIRDTCPGASSGSRNAGKLNKALYKSSTSFIYSFRYFWTALCLIGRLESGEQRDKCGSLSLDWSCSGVSHNQTELCYEGIVGIGVIGSVLGS